MGDIPLANTLTANVERLQKAMNVCTMTTTTTTTIIKPHIEKGNKKIKMVHGSKSCKTSPSFVFMCYYEECWITTTKTNYSNVRFGGVGGGRVCM